MLFRFYPLVVFLIIINVILLAKGYVPYRNNKLTMLMKDSIGGNVFFMIKK